MKEKLLVSVISGTRLKKKKTWVLVKLSLHSDRYKTKYVNGGDSVRFQKETFIFEVNEDVYPAGTLELTLQTWEMLSSGESFAFGSVALAEVCAKLRQSAEYCAGEHNQHQVTVPLKSKRGEDIEECGLVVGFELVPELDCTTMKSIPLLFRWFPELPHSEMVISECYCTKQAKIVGISHSGTLYICQNYICFRSPSQLAKNKKFIIPFREITSIKKKIGSFYLPNAIQIRTTKKKYVFASFIHRKKAFKMLTSQWNLLGGHNSIEEKEEDDDDNEEDDEEEDRNEIIQMTNSLKNNKLTFTKGQAPQKLQQLTSSTKSNSGGNLMSPNIHLVVDMDDFEQLGMPSNQFQMSSLQPETTIREVLERLRQKISHSSKGDYQLFKMKPLKSSSLSLSASLAMKKKAHRSSKTLYRVQDSSVIDTNSVTLLHRNPKTQVGSNALVERKFFPLEPTKTVSYYSNLNSNDLVLYFKKPIAVAEIHASFEVFEDPNTSSSVSLLVAVDRPIGEMFKEIIKILGGLSARVSHDPSQYYFYLPKNPERGVVLDSNRCLRDYNITVSNIGIQVRRRASFTGFDDKFKLEEKKASHQGIWENYLFFEMISSMLHYPLPDCKVSLENQNGALDRLQECLKIDNIDAKMITKNLVYHSSFKDEGLLIELRSKLLQLSEDDAIPNYYAEQSFFTKSDYQQWRLQEQQNLIHLMKSIIFKSEYFIGTIFIDVHELSGVSSGKRKELNPYIVLSYNNNEKSIKTNTYKSANEEGEETLFKINEHFKLTNYKSRGKLLEIIIMNASTDGGQDEMIDRIELPIKDFEDTQVVSEKYYHLSNTTGKLLLSIEYHYQFEEFNQFINQFLNNEIDKTIYTIHPDSHFNNHHQFKNLFEFIINNSSLFSEISIQDADDIDFDASEDQEQDKQWINNSVRILLNEYCLRYGISKSTFLITQLEILLANFNLSESFILELEEVLQQLNSTYKIQSPSIITSFSLDSTQTSLIFTKSETQTLLSSIDKCSLKLRSVIGNYFENFPNNKPRGCLKSLIKSYELIVNIQKNNNINYGEFKDLLIDCIRSESKKKFEDNLNAMGLVNLALDLKIQNIKEITGMLTDLVGIIQEEINGTLQFESAFPKEVKVTCEVIESWGACLSNLIADYCSWAPYCQEFTLTLLKKLLDYHNFTKSLSGERFKPLPLNQHFITYVYKLLKEEKLWLHDLAKESLLKDDKKTQASMTLGYTSSFQEFSSGLDKCCKDFESLLWLPDSFSYVQLLEVISSETIYFIKLTITEIHHFILHTQVEESDLKPTVFTLNVQPCRLMNNLESMRSKYDQLAAKIQKSLKEKNENQQSLSASTSPKLIESNSCVESSFQMCLSDSTQIIQSLIDENDQLLIKRINNFIYFSFQEVLLSEQLSQKNNHLIEQVSDEAQVNGNGIASTSSSPPQMTSPNIHSSTGSGGSAGGGDQVSNLISSTNSSRSASPMKDILQQSQYTNQVKQIIAPIKEFLSPKIEELYGALKETKFKLLIKKCWIELMAELRFLFIYRDSLEKFNKGSKPKPETLGQETKTTYLDDENECKKRFYKEKKVLLNDEQYGIFRSAIKEIMTLFHRSGSGCATPILEEKYQPLKTLLMLSEMDTTTLIDHYNGRRTPNMIKSSTFNPSKDSIAAILLTRAEFDKESRTFTNKLLGIVEPTPTASLPPIIEESIPNVLPASEFIIDKYHCSYQGQLGLLMMSSRYLAFHNLLRQVGVSFQISLTETLFSVT